MSWAPEEGISDGERLRYLLADDMIWKLGEAVPRPAPGSPGRPRHYPEWVNFLYCASVTVFLSARKAAVELRDRWPEIVKAAQERYPDDPTMWPPASAPRRHHWQHAKKRLNGPELECVRDTFERIAASQAVEVGIGAGSGSLTHPSLDNALQSDGKVITPLYRAKPKTPVVDRDTGELLRYKRSEPDAMLHMTGEGVEAYGVKFVFTAGRVNRWHGRVITSVDHVHKRGGEARVAVESIERIAALHPNVQVILYDGAMRGIHHRDLMRDVGLIVVSPPTAARAETKDTKREEKVTFIENTETPDGVALALYARGGSLGVMDHNADGDEVFVTFQNLRRLRRKNANGSYRFYGEYQLPLSLGGGKIMVRADTTDEDEKRGVNRSENLRLFAPEDEDYQRLYPRRSDIESNNRQLDDSLYIRRAHSKGAMAQLLDLIGYAAVYNAIAVGLTRSQAPPGQLDVAA
jgi:hypothetical protein